MWQCANNMAFVDEFIKQNYDILISIFIGQNKKYNNTQSTFVRY